MSDTRLQDWLRIIAEKSGATTDATVLLEAADEITRLRAQLEVAERALRNKGYRKSCEISECNCGDQWNHGGNAEQRLSEIADAVRTNGETVLQSVQRLVTKVETLTAGRDTALREWNAELTKNEVLTADCSRYMADALGLREENARLNRELDAWRPRWRLSPGLVERLRELNEFCWQYGEPGKLIRDILAEVTTEQETKG